MALKVIVSARYLEMYCVPLGGAMGKKGRSGVTKATSTQATSGAKSALESTGGGSKSSELLHKEWISPNFERVLLQIFSRFDLDGNGRLSVDELQAFAKVCNSGEIFSEDELEQIEQCFDTDDGGGLTKRGFFQMYHMQTTARQEDTWKDLKALGYTESLDVLSDAAPASGQSDTASVNQTLTHTAAAPKEGPALESAKAELRDAFLALREIPEAAAAHLRVAAALEALGRGDAAARSRQQAEALAEKARG